MQDPTTRRVYEDWLPFRSVVGAAFFSKDSKQIKRLASAWGVSIPTLRARIESFIYHRFLKRLKNSYAFTAWNKVADMLNFKRSSSKSTKKYLKGKSIHVYVKIKLESKGGLSYRKQFELKRLKLLLEQKQRQQEYSKVRKSASNKAFKIYKESHDSSGYSDVELSYRQIEMIGGYSSHTQVASMLKELESLGEIQIHSHKLIVERNVSGISYRLSKYYWNSKYEYHAKKKVLYELKSNTYTILNPTELPKVSRNIEEKDYEIPVAKPKRKARQKFSIDSDCLPIYEAMDRFVSDHERYFTLLGYRRKVQRRSYDTLLTKIFCLKYYPKKQAVVDKLITILFQYIAPKNIKLYEHAVNNFFLGKESNYTDTNDADYSLLNYTYYPKAKLVADNDGCDQTYIDGRVKEREQLQVLLQAEIDSIVPTNDFTGIVSYLDLLSPEERERQIQFEKEIAEFNTVWDEAMNEEKQRKKQLKKERIQKLTEFFKQCNLSEYNGGI